MPELLFLGTTTPEIHLRLNNTTTLRIDSPTEHPLVQIKYYDSGLVIQHPDGTIAHITGRVTNPHPFAANVLIFSAHGQEEQLIKKLRPKLAILTAYDELMLKQNPMYVARDLHQKTGVHVIAAHNGLVVDLLAYAALSSQKTLAKFTPTTQPKTQARTRT